MLCIGIAAVIAAIGFLIHGMWNDYTARINSEATVQLLNEQIADNQREYEGRDAKNTQEYLESIPELIEINGEFYIGVLRIPALALELPVNNNWSSERLRSSPCRHSGDLTSSLVVVAHNFRSQFGRLGRLSSGDKLLITDGAGNEHWYNIESVAAIRGTNIAPMIDESYDLTLFTCTLDRQHRTVVRSNRISLDSVPFPGYDIRQGQVNGNVLLIQRYLNRIRSIQPDIAYLEEDASFGPITRNAVLTFQELYSLPDTGIVDSATWNRILMVYNTVR